jgi:hypothetical protein
MATAARRPRPRRRLFVRREIWALERTNIWDPTTLAFAKAIQTMKQKQFPQDQTNYEYQASMHGSNTTAGRGPDGVWNMCQHQSWFFFPWHRMYILWFEHIMRDIVRSQGGPANWALPYWNWEANRVLPPAFREHNLPQSAGGGPNPLFRQDRTASIKNGNPMAATVVDTTAAMNATQFNGAFAFGGGVINNPSHFGAQLQGLLEQKPHNIVHSTIGGPTGVMNSAESPLDPIFWLHHANVDRLWGRWLRQGNGRANPTQQKWLDQAFDFYKAPGQKTTQHCKGVRSTSALGYRYDDDPPPVALPLTAIVPERGEAALRGLEALNVVNPEPKEVGASGAVELGRGASSAEIPLAAEPAQELSLLAQPNTAPSRVALIVDGIRVEEAAPPYEVYLNLDDPGEGGEHDSPHFVGFLEFFGADHEHGEHAEHDHGVMRAFDITSLVHQLQEEGQWDPSRARVSFVPARLFEEEESGDLLPAEVEGEPKVQVGAVRIVSE